MTPDYFKDGKDKAIPAIGDGHFAELQTRRRLAEGSPR